MYLDYFDKFYNMKPYLEINEKEWEYIKETFDKEDVKESLKSGNDLPITISQPYRKKYKDFMKLKGMKWNEIMVEGDWYPREGTQYTYDLKYDGKPLYFRRLTR